MKRRQFLSLAAGVTGVTGTALVAGCSRARPDARDVDSGTERKKAAVHMYLGCQRGPTTAEMLQFFKRHGVDHICGYPVRADPQRGYWTEAELAAHRESCARRTASSSTSSPCRS